MSDERPPDAPEASTPLRPPLMLVPRSTYTPGEPGRKPSYSPERAARILSALRAGNTLRASAQYGGINEDTLIAWRRRYPDFAQRVADAQAAAEVSAVAQVKKASKTDWKAAAWWLERRQPQEWGRVDRLEVSIQEKAQVLAASLGVTVDELMREAQRLVDTGAVLDVEATILPSDGDSRADSGDSGSDPDGAA